MSILRSVSGTELNCTLRQGAFHSHRSCALLFHVDSVPYVKIISPLHRFGTEPLRQFRLRLARGEVVLPEADDYSDSDFEEEGDSDDLVPSDEGEEAQKAEIDVYLVERKDIIQLVRLLLTPQEERSDFDFEYLLAGEKLLGGPSVFVQRQTLSEKKMARLKSHFGSVTDGSTTSSFTQLRLYRKETLLCRVLEHFASSPWSMPWLEAGPDRLQKIQAGDAFDHLREGKSDYWKLRDDGESDGIRRVFENRIGLLLARILKFRSDFTNAHIISGRSGRHLEFFLAGD